MAGKGFSAPRARAALTGAALMEFGGRYHVAAPRLAVWEALNDTTVLKAAIPGCHRIEWAGEAALELEIKVNLGVVHPVFRGGLTLSDIVAAERYTLAGRGKGGLLGLAEGAADIVLSDLGEETELVFTANGGASGQIMRLGKAIIGNSAQRVIDGFFERFGMAMGAVVTPLPPP
jgi:carbon monoxide dehydrogenase subunit G